MYIHNFYTDLLLSLRVLFDDYVFRNPFYITRYEFNIGNRTFQLPSDYRTNVDLPIAIVSLNDETSSFGQRPSVSQGLIGYNIDQIPVLYNTDNDICLYVQEESCVIPINVTFNCESQLQAKEVANVIRRWLPYNKYIQILEFTSYLEISNQFLADTNFHVDYDNIINLYMKTNKKTGRLNYCFAISYKPLIRMDSITAPLPDSTQRTFQAIVDLSYMIQFPLSLFSDSTRSFIERIDIDIYNTLDIQPICNYPSTKMINLDNSAADKKGFIRRQVVVYETSNVNQYNKLLDSGTLLSDAISIKSNSNLFTITRTVDNKINITLNNTTYKIPISLITLTGYTYTIDTDYFFLISKDGSDNITVLYYKIMYGVTLKFDSTDFLITTDYSYNIFKTINDLIRDYTDYTINLDNSVTLNFINSLYQKYLPSVTSPLIIQFYNKTAIQPKAFYGQQPDLSHIFVQSVSSDAAVIIWISRDETTSRVQYGLTTSYGNFTDIDDNLVNNHSIVIRGLSAATTYHFRINIDGTLVSSDYTFTTNP